MARAAAAQAAMAPEDRAAGRSSSTSAIKPGRIRKYDHRTSDLYPDYDWCAGLRLLSSRQTVHGAGKNSRHLFARAQGSDLRKPARPEFRIQSRQVSRL